MNLFSPRSWSLLQKRLLVAGLSCLPLGAACSNDDEAPATPVTVTLAFVGFDGAPTVADSVPLRCDGTLAVELSITTVPDNAPFTLRPAHDCANSARCGYLEVQALDANGETLASVKTATVGALLQIQPADRGAVAELKASLLRGIDDKPVLNPDGAAVTASISPTFAPTTDCPEPSTGGAGAGGAANAGGAAGAVTGGVAGEATAIGGAGAGGSAGSPAGGAGAAGDSAMAGVGGI
jgi:hypothetical protein